MGRIEIHLDDDKIHDLLGSDYFAPEVKTIAAQALNEAVSGGWQGFETRFEAEHRSPAGVSESVVSFENVYVVQMKLRWFQSSCEPCGLWIVKDRLVVFDVDGILLDVFLDGEAFTPVT